MTTFTTLTVIEARANYELERLADPSLPAWEAATYMTRSRYLRAASVVVERAA